MKTKTTLQMAVLMAGLSLLSFKSEAQTSWDFSYGYLSVLAPNALNYVVQQQNIEVTDEGAGISYMNPVNSGSPAILTQEFTFSGPTTEIYLTATIDTFNFGGGNVGSGSLWASTDDVNWVLLESAPSPSTLPVSSATYNYFADLPSSLLGADQIYIQTQLQTTDADILAQFSRQQTSFDGGIGVNDGGNVFELDANHTSAVPESSTMSLFGIGLAILAFASKGTKNSIA
jgi:hypothetical protein